jgi:hypothetical protein
MAPAARASSGGSRTSSRSAPNASVIACERRSSSNRALSIPERPAASIRRIRVIELPPLEHDPLAQGAEVSIPGLPALLLGRP